MYIEVEKCSAFCCIARFTGMSWIVFLFFFMCWKDVII